MKRLIMRKHIFNKLIIIVAALFLLHVQVVAGTYNKKLPTVLTPYLQNPTADGMTICFLTQGAKDVRLEWNTDGASTFKKLTGKGIAITGTPWTIWKIRIANLKPGDKYKYQLKYFLANKKSSTQIYHFKTLNPRSKTLHIALFNDLHNNDSTLSILMRYIKPDDFEFSMLIGDCLADPCSDNGAFNVFRTWDAYIRLLDGANKPIVFVRGNHETRNSFSHQIAVLFDLPNLRTEQTWEEQQWQFTLRSGPVHFLVMDTGEDDDDLTKPDSYKQPIFWQSYRQHEAEWLKKLNTTNAGKDAAWRIFVSHIPLYNNNPWYSASSRQYWESLLPFANPDLMLAGHDHGWKLLQKNDEKKQQWPVLIGGGPSLDEGTVMLLSADNKKLSIRLLAAKDGRLLTEFNADKNNIGNKPNNQR
jgi:hypothetical protein